MEWFALCGNPYPQMCIRDSYGYLEGSRQSKLPGDWGMRDCFYALDTGSGQLLSLHFIRPGWGFLLQGVELLAEEGETPAFYTLPSGF